jgi:hypothetical protein
MRVFRIGGGVVFLFSASAGIIHNYRIIVGFFGEKTRQAENILEERPL